MSRTRSCNAWKPARTTGCLESSSGCLQTSYRNKQCLEQSLSRFICFLLSSREVENMIEAERPSVSTVLDLFCTWIGAGRGIASHLGKPPAGNHLQPHDSSFSINSHIFSSRYLYLHLLCIRYFLIWPDWHLLPDLKSAPGIKKLDAKRCLCLHQWRLFVSQGRPSSVLQDLLFVKLASHLIKKKVPYFEVHAFWKGILMILWFKLASMSSSNYSAWGFTYLCGNILELTIQLVLKKNQWKCSCTELSSIKPCSEVFHFCLLSQ